MQVERAPGSGGEGNALTVLPLARAREFLTEKQVYQAGSASLITVSDTVRFSHQLLQEYFAARYMDTEIKAGRLQASTIWKPENWWERTNWEEAAILLAGLYSDNCTPVLNWLANANPGSGGVVHRSQWSNHARRHKTPLTGCVDTTPD